MRNNNLRTSSVRTNQAGRTQPITQLNTQSITQLNT